MTQPPTSKEGADGLRVLVVGATGSVGREVVAESLRQGHLTRALVRSGTDVDLPDGAELVEGQLTDPDTLGPALEGVDAVVFTHGSHGSAADAERVDYGAVHNVLQALDGRAVRVSLMTTIGVTKHTPGHDWKRRGERLVRASGLPYTVVRPGWFDYNDPDQLQITMLQGDRRRAGDASDGVVSRAQIAQVLVAGLTSPGAVRKTLELVAEHGPAPADLDPLFAELQADPPGVGDAALDRDDMPANEEPPGVRDDLHAVADRFAADSGGS